MSRRFGALRRIPVKVLAQIAVSVALIAILLSLDLPALLVTLAGVDPVLMGLAVLLTFVYTFLLSERWRFILRGLDVRQKPLPAFDLTMRGYFFGTVLPSNAGGDVVKAYLLSRRGPGLGIVLLSILLDRVTGMAALLWMGALAGWLAAESSELAAQVSWLSLGGLALIVTVAGVGGPALLPLLERPTLSLTPRFAQPAMRATLTTLGRLSARPMLFLVPTLLSFPLQVFYIFTVHLVVLALHAEVPADRLTLAVTWATLAGALPISFSGFGPREGAYVATLGSPQLGLAVGLITGVLQIVSGLPGGLLQLLERSPVPVTDVSSELVVAGEPGQAASP